MRKRVVLTAILVSLTLTAAATWAEEEEGIIDSLVKACQEEIDDYCNQVAPGGGRLLACFYAHGDKISARCEYALYNAAADLERFAATVTHLAKSCRDDLLEHCGKVEMGEGRVASCLLEHKADVTEACRQASDDAGLEVDE